MSATDDVIAFWQARLPDIVFVGGKKRSGKDFLCDLLVQEAGFTKVHIVEPWLRAFFERRGIDPNRWEELKAQYRAEIQAEAETARAADPDCLIKTFREAIPTLPRPFCVTAVRFINEMELGVQTGALCVRVKTSAETRKQRFLASGDDLALLDDPFEREVDLMPVHIELSGELPGEMYVPVLANVYERLQLIAFQESQRALTLAELRSLIN